MSELQTNSEKKTRFKYPNLIPLWFSIFIDILGFTILLTILPKFILTISGNELLIGFILSINAIFTLVFAPILGKLSDKYGRLPLLLISQIGTAIGFLLMGFSTTLGMLIVSRVIDGIFGGNFPIAKAIISDTVPPGDRAVQMTNVGVCHVLASLVGPGMGGILYNLGGFGMLAPGLASTGLSITTIIITILILKETWPKSKRNLPKEKVELKLRKNTTALYLLTQFGFHTISFMIYITTIAGFAYLVLGLTPPEVGLLLTISGIFRAIYRFTIFEPLLRKLGENRTLILGLGSFVVVFILVGFVQNPIQFGLVLILVSFAASCTRGIIISKITRSVTPREQGAINGYSTALDSLAQILGPLIGFFILGTFQPYWLGFIMGMLSLASFLMVFKKLELRK
ncbi:MAG: MFS transporter [Candidatus Helarchaeota archaeon]|nr:MFS transporter [Candidatus Helarchaeota archaeon]